MSRLSRLFGLVLLALFMVDRPMLAADAARPNIIVMMTDDQRHDFLSCAGHPFLKTPNMDRIAQQGVRFQNMFVTNALCAPSRATLMTGLYSHANGVIDNMGTRLREDVTWMPDVLRKAGYEVALCGKSHVPGHFRNKKWDYYFGFQGQGNYYNARVAESDADGKIGPDKAYEGWMDDVVTDHAVAWMKRKREKPFALFLFFKSPHRQWVPAERNKKLFAETPIPKPPLWDEPGASKPRAFLQAANIIGQFPDTKNFEEMIRDYARCVKGVDDNVGKVLDTLDGLKIEDNTAVLYTSDNGFFLGEWMRFDKRFMHEPSIRVPMLVRLPKAKYSWTPGSLLKPMILNVDIAPTVLDLAGATSPTPMHGKSFVPLITAKKDTPVQWRDAWYYEYHEFPDPSHNVNKMRGVRTDKWKYIHYYDPPFKFREEFELYDLESDPQEIQNLVNRPKFKTVVAEMQQKMVKLREELGAK